MAPRRRLAPTGWASTVITVAVLAAVTACARPTGARTSPDTAAALSAPPGVPCRVLDGKADRRCTPGALNPAVTQATIGQTICTTGWADLERPSTSYTTALKRRQMRDYGETGALSGYEEDHLVSLSAGGNPTDPANLFPQPIGDAHVKDQTEAAVHKAICGGRITLKQGQDQLLTQWSHP